MKEPAKCVMDLHYVVQSLETHLMSRDGGVGLHHVRATRDQQLRRVLATLATSYACGTPLAGAPLDRLLELGCSTELARSVVFGWSVDFFNEIYSTLRMAGWVHTEPVRVSVVDPNLLVMDIMRGAGYEYAR